MITPAGRSASRALHRSARLWMLGTGGALFAVVAVLFAAYATFERRMVRELEEDQLAATTQQRLVDWALTVHEASLAEEVTRLARSADLKDAIVAGTREGLLEQLEPPLNRLRKSPLAVVRLTLYTGDGRLRVHAQDPDDVGASSIDERRLMQAALRDRKVAKGVEVVSGVPHMLAASPVYHDGKIVGFLEMGTPLTPITHALHAVTGAEVDVSRTVIPSGRPTRRVVYRGEQPLVVSVVPLMAFSGEPVGHVELVSEVSRTLTTLRRSQLVAFAITFVGCAIAGTLLVLHWRRLDKVYARLEQLHATAEEHRDRAERRAAGLAAVSVMTRSIASARTPGEAGSAVATAATTLLGAALTVVWVRTEDPTLLLRAFSWGSATEGDPAPTVLASRAGAGLAGRVFTTRVAEYRADIQDERDVLNARFVQEAGLHAYAGLPLVARGESVGVVQFVFKDLRAFTDEEKELMLLLADSVAIAVDRSLAENVL